MTNGVTTGKKGKRVIFNFSSVVTCLLLNGCEQFCQYWLTVCGLMLRKIYWGHISVLHFSSRAFRYSSFSRPEHRRSEPPWNTGVTESRLHHLPDRKPTTCGRTSRKPCHSSLTKNGKTANWRAAPCVRWTRLLLQWRNDLNGSGFGGRPHFLKYTFGPLPECTRCQKILGQKFTLKKILECFRRN